MTDFDFDAEFSKLCDKYTTVSSERVKYIFDFSVSDHTDDDYRRFLRTLSHDEYFFEFDLLYLFHQRSIRRLRDFFISRS